MQPLTRIAACALAVLFVASAAVPLASAGQTQTDDIRDLAGSTISASSQSVQFENIGIVISVTPVVKARDARSETMFVLLDDAIFFNCGTDRAPCWEPISEREFGQLIAELEDAGFDLAAEMVEEKLILGVVLMF